MNLFQCPFALCFYAAAFVLTGIGSFLRHASPLPYLGGLCWVLATLGALLAGVPMQEILLCTLVLLTASWLRREGETPK